jgi:hypothetical protein
MFEVIELALSREHAVFERHSSRLLGGYSFRLTRACREVLR